MKSHSIPISPVNYFLSMAYLARGFTRFQKLETTKEKYTTIPVVLIMAITLTVFWVNDPNESQNRFVYVAAIGFLLLPIAYVFGRDRMIKDLKEERRDYQVYHCLMGGLQTLNQAYEHPDKERGVYYQLVSIAHMECFHE